MNEFELFQFFRQREQQKEVPKKKFRNKNEALSRTDIEHDGTTKSQIISKSLFGVSNSPQKTNLKTQIFALAY